MAENETPEIYIDPEGDEYIVTGMAYHVLTSEDLIITRKNTDNDTPVLAIPKDIFEEDFKRKK